MRFADWVTILEVHLPERTETGGPNYASDQTVRAVHSCNSWFLRMIQDISNFKFKQIGDYHNNTANWDRITSEFSFALVFTVVLFHTLGISRWHNTLFLSSPHLRLIIGLTRDFCFLSCFIDGLGNVMRTKCFETLQKLRARVMIQ